MNDKRIKSLINSLREEYARYSPESGRLQLRAAKVMMDGGSHSIRLGKPFPPRIRSARGAYVYDQDGHKILDFWQGHHANILGHNCPSLTEKLAEAFSSGFGLQTGFTDLLQIELAELLCGMTGAERVRFTTSGTLATMYAILLARAYTGRDMVMKVGGGWHGAQPWGLKGVDFNRATDDFQHIDSSGLPVSVTDNVIVTRFNDCQMLADNMRRFGDRIACFILEPFIGAGGFFPADREFMKTARELADRSGGLLIFDEVISGFRFHPGSAGGLYGITPDLATYGKIIGGGMPVSAVAGRAGIMELAGSKGGNKVKFSGGTYSAHPSSMLAAKIQLEYLRDHAADVYPHINRLGEAARKAAEKAFREAGVYACCTGYGNDVITGSSLGMVFFPKKEGYCVSSPEDTRNPEICHAELGEEALKLALLLDNVYVMHGLGSISTAHTDGDVSLLYEACRKAAGRIKKAYDS